MNKISCSICKETVVVERVHDILILPYRGDETPDLFSTCSNCAENVLLYIRDLKKDFSMLPKPKQKRKKCVSLSVKKTK